MTFGPRGTAVNVGLPGTGFSYRQQLRGAPPLESPVPASISPRPTLPPSAASIPLPPAPSGIVGEIRSADNEALTSVSLKELRDLLAEAYAESQRLKADIPAADSELHSAQSRAYRWEHGILLKHIMKKKFASILGDYQSARKERDELTSEIEKCRVALEVEMEGGIETTYGTVVETFRALAGCERCWDTMSSVAVDQFRERSTATSSVTRSPIVLDLAAADVIAPSKPAIHFQNANGADLYVLPGLLLMFGSHVDFALIRLAEARLEYSAGRFIESEGVPADTTQVGETWAKVNKDGSPDRRFSNNYKIPIVLYGYLTFKSAAGLNEGYMFSNSGRAEAFAKAFAAHRASLPST